MDTSGQRFPISRDRLYELVWSEPMVRLAKRFVVTDVALAKTCKRMGIPVPPRGYWRRRETGYQVGRPALPPLKPGMPPQVELKLLREPAEITRALDPEVEAQKTFEARTENRITVAQRLTKPHPLITQVRLAMAVAKPALDGCVAPGPGKGLDIRVTPRLLPRALRVMDALVKALETRGAKVGARASDGRGSRVELLGEQLSIMAGRLNVAVEPNAGLPFHVVLPSIALRTRKDAVPDFPHQAGHHRRSRGGRYLGIPRTRPLSATSGALPSRLSSSVGT